MINNTGRLSFNQWLSSKFSKSTIEMGGSLYPVLSYIKMAWDDQQSIINMLEQSIKRQGNALVLREKIVHDNAKFHAENNVNVELALLRKQLQSELHANQLLTNEIDRLERQSIASEFTNEIVSLLNDIADKNVGLDQFDSAKSLLCRIEQCQENLLMKGMPHHASNKYTRFYHWPISGPSYC